MLIYRQLAPHSAVALAIVLSLFVPTALAERASITVTNVGRVTLEFRPAMHRAGNFGSIEIRSVAGAFHFVPKTPIARIPEDADERSSSGLWDKVSGLQLDTSRFFFRGDYISDGQPHTLLFFVSEGGASDAAPLLVVGFSYVGEPYKVLELDKFDITAFQRATDNTGLIIGKTTLSQVMGEPGAERAGRPYATTYDPYSVYVVHAEGTAYYSLGASRRYNQQHYVWAGSHSREDFAVFYNLPGHSRPFGAPATRVNDLLSIAKATKPQ
jgi:hypothetical protein